MGGRKKGRVHEAIERARRTRVKDEKLVAALAVGALTAVGASLVLSQLLIAACRMGVAAVNAAFGG